jgi:hypothetical protein
MRRGQEPIAFAQHGAEIAVEILQRFVVVEQGARVVFVQSDACEQFARGEVVGTLFHREDLR